MEQEEIFQKAQAGDRLAYKEWTEEWFKTIGIFGYQNGVSEASSAKYITAVFETFYSQMPKVRMHEAEICLFQIASSSTPRFRADSAGALLKFEEDIEAHRLLQDMEEKQRIPFILYYLHGKQMEEIALIVGEGGQEISETLNGSLASLTNKLGLDSESGTLKRLELLKKSYSRILFELEEAKPVEEEMPIPLKAEAKPAGADKKSKVLLWSAGVFLAGVIGASFFMDDPNSNIASPVAEAEESDTVTASMVEAWKEQYKKAKESSPERLGVNPEVFNELVYVKKADQQMKRTFSENNIEKLKNDPKQMQHEVNLLLLKIETPKEMLTMLPELYLISDELIPVMDGYANKTTELIHEGDQVLKEHESLLAEMTVNGEMSPKKLLAQPEGVPEEVKNLVSSISERGLTIAKHPTDDRFILRNNMDTLYMNDQLNVMYDFNLLRHVPHFDDEGLLVPVQEMAFALSMLELILLEDEVSSGKFEEYAHVFQHSLWLLMKGDENQQVFDEEGIVKEPYQLAWKELGQQTRNPLIYVMLPIIEEMEASGWTESASLDQLEYSTIMDALMLEKNGELAKKLPNDDVKIETQRVMAEDFFTPYIEELYFSFTAEFDKNLLKEVSPLDVYRMFQFANQQKNPEVMWHLMDENKPPFEEYKAGWRQQPHFAEEIRWMEISEDALNRFGKMLIVYPYISYLEEETIMSYQPELVMAKNHIWEVKSHLYEHYESAGAAGPFKEEVERLYAAFSSGLDDSALAAASPGEVGALFLLAVEKKNFDMVKALTLGEQKQPTDIMEAQLAARGVVGLSAIGILKFFSDPSHMMPNEMSSSSLWFKDASTNDSGIYGSQLSMVKTPEGWRMEDLSMY